MKCPYCRADNDKVIDSRASQDGFAIRRRRQCLHCDRRYTTYERIEEAVLKVIKKDGSREPFSREKLRAGLERACRKRPISDEQLDQVVTSIEDEVYATYDAEVVSRVLGELSLARLKPLDAVAYVRFASVYRDFQSVRDFIQELEPMLAAYKVGQL